MSSANMIGMFLLLSAAAGSTVSAHPDSRSPSPAGSVSYSALRDEIRVLLEEQASHAPTVTTAYGRAHRRYKALEYAVRWCDPSFILPLKEILRKDESRYAQQAARALLKYRDPELRAYVASFSADERFNMRQSPEGSPPFRVWRPSIDDLLKECSGEAPWIGFLAEALTEASADSGCYLAWPASWSADIGYGWRLLHRAKDARRLDAALFLMSNGIVTEPQVLIDAWYEKDDEYRRMFLRLFSLDSPYGGESLRPIATDAYRLFTGGNLSTIEEAGMWMLLRVTRAPDGIDEALRRLEICLKDEEILVVDYWDAISYLCAVLEQYDHSKVELLIASEAADSRAMGYLALARGESPEAARRCIDYIGSLDVEQFGHSESAGLVLESLLQRPRDDGASRRVFESIYDLADRRLSKSEEGAVGTEADRMVWMCLEALAGLTGEQEPLRPIGLQTRDRVLLRESLNLWKKWFATKGGSPG